MAARAITFTFDVEDPRPATDLPQRFDGTTRQVLDLLDELAVRGTFFVVGTAAKAAPRLVREIADRGHEVGLHSFDHTMLPDQTPDQFREATVRGKQLVEEFSGTRVVGYRAPNFSLVRASVWATEVLDELGFAYSSSTLPAAHPIYGFPGLPATPFRWPCGLLELPAPVGRFGPVVLPFLGGVYFRYFPAWLVRRQLARVPDDAAPWFYAHPYDYDPEQPFYRMHNVSFPVSAVLWLNRRGTLAHTRALFTSHTVVATPPFRHLLAAGHFAGAPAYTIGE